MQPDKTLDAIYDTGGATLQLSVTIGERQLGFSRVYLNGEKLDTPGDHITDFAVGTDVGGSTLTVRTIINDVNPLTNRVSATYTLKANARPQQWRLEDVVEQNNQDLYFRADFNLT